MVAKMGQSNLNLDVLQLLYCICDVETFADAFRV